jgi:predicted glutamine amidotransferase
MCLLIMSPGGTNIPRDHIETASIQNRDGFGWAVVADDRIITNVSMDLDVAMAEFYAARAEFPNGDALFHLRIATSGRVDEFNCHPFYVGEGGRTVMAHNGMLDIELAVGEERSDTHVFATDYIDELGLKNVLDDPELNQLVTKWALGSKLVFLSVDPELNHQRYFINETSGHWEAGVWYSNYMYDDSYYMYRQTWSPKGGWQGSAGSYIRKDYSDLSQGGATWAILWDDNMEWPQPRNGYRFSNDELYEIYELDLETACCQW